MDFNSSSTVTLPCSSRHVVSGMCSPRSRTATLSKTLLQPCWHNASIQSSIGFVRIFPTTLAWNTACDEYFYQDIIRMLRVRLCHCSVWRMEKLKFFHTSRLIGGRLRHRHRFPRNFNVIVRPLPRRPRMGHDEHFKHQTGEGRP